MPCPSDRPCSPARPLVSAAPPAGSRRAAYGLPKGEHRHRSRRVARVVRLLLLPMSPTEAEITADLVRVLLEEQHPDLADLPVRLGARG
ncbi:hypothetical protein GCM10010220_55750 [Streptomyces parvulus]|nr:hypothetical protein GCM10010220_55750 [Streptomyces parvulus]